MITNMAIESLKPRLKACHCCGLIHRLRRLQPREFARCVRCHAVVEKFAGSDSTAKHTAAITLAALILFWPAVLLPILQIERLGHRNQSSVVGGVIELLQHGNWFVGTIVLLFSLIFPLLKIGLLLELSLLGTLHRRNRALTYRVMEHLGKWSMMDVMLLAFMVMLVKLGSLVQFQFGPAVIAFVLCVGLSIWASVSFNPHAIWEEMHE
jgi:paraquat-inducible protein A